MSLINEALKKAQRQRTSDPVVVAPAPSGTAEAPVARIAKRRAPMPARTLVILVGGGVSLLLMAGLLTFLFWEGDETPAPKRATPPKPVVAGNPQAAAPAAAPVADTPIAIPAAPVTPAPAPTVPMITVQLPPVIVPVTPPEVAAPPMRPVAVTPQPPAPAQPSATVRTPTGNPRVYQFLETLRVAGIRVSDTDPKVIMNDRVFRLNDLVDRNTQLRLIRVNSNSLIFSDANGFEYEKPF